MFGKKLLTVSNVCSLLVVIRIYYSFTVQNTDDIYLQAKPCEIAKSYVFNDTSHIIPFSSNTSIIYPLLSCVPPYQFVKIFNYLSPIQINNSSNLMTFLTRTYSIEISLFIQTCFFRICDLSAIFDIDSCKLLYCSSMIILSLTSHNICLYSILLYWLIIFVWFIMESRRFCWSTNMIVIRMIISGIITTIGIFIHSMFIFYAYPYIIYMFIDNALIWKLISKENASKGVARTTMNLSIWSTFFAMAVIGTTIVCILLDLAYFRKPRMIPIDQIDSFWNDNNNWKSYPLYTHLFINIPYLYSFLLFYVMYFMYKYGIKGLEIAVFYSKEMALLVNSDTLKQLKRDDKDFEKKLRSPIYLTIFYYVLLINLFSSICILSLCSYQSYQLLIPLFLPFIILASAAFQPWFITRNNQQDNENDKNCKDDKAQRMIFTYFLCSPFHLQ